MKSLGADESTIRRLFLAESATIGSVGAIGGIALGWIISRIASVIAKAFMAKEGVDPIELFALPWWLIGIAFALGFVVSLLAGYYPARRAARVDPVEALRNE
jgi:putative ABC transport system permease protein